MNWILFFAQNLDNSAFSQWIDEETIQMLSKHELKQFHSSFLSVHQAKAEFFCKKGKISSLIEFTKFSERKEFTKFSVNRPLVCERALWERNNLLRIAQWFLAYI